MEQAGIKGFIKSILDSNALSRNLIMNPIRNYTLHKHYLSLLPLNELDKESKDLWLERIRKVKVSSDNAKINTISNSGKLKDGKLTMHNGIVIDPLSYYGAPVMRMLMENNAIHEPQEEYVFQEVLKCMPENATMLELGCYWGFYSMWFASKIKGAKNFLIDNHDGIARAQSNFKMNGLKADFMTGYIGKDNPESSITITNVDRICKEKGISFLDILHSDIQGFELEMLETASGMITKRAIGFIFISTHSQELHYNCIEFLKQNGYIILCDADLEDSFSEDGLIVARDPSYKGPDSYTISSRKKEDLPA
jgi:hypothetical protein